MFFISTVSYLQGEDLSESGQKKTTKVSFIFAGDIMQHKTQIKAAQKAPGVYDYTSVFQFIQPILKKYDFAVGNLETTFGGEPYSGYPAFSAPDTLAWFLKNAGFNVLVTANNHCSDRGKKGLSGTLNALDRFAILNTGVFRDEKQKNANNPLILEKNGIKTALLNYTYGTNNNNTSLLINKIDTAAIEVDIKKARSLKADAVIVFFHWGNEYSRTPSDYQKRITDFCFRMGVNAVIGSHPHVVQKVRMNKFQSEQQTINTITVYSLGNLVSNQRWRYSDGGLMVGFDLIRKEGSQIMSVENVDIQPVWVHAFFGKDKKHYDILPVKAVESGEIKPEAKSIDEAKFKVFKKDIEELLDQK